ncbi:MAG: YjjG family noncanonical pyrimidine nucleotidase [Lachnospiraceae bacterium]|nr:YjjG family noncanonical pyrimidine nucleotidase [Lachnospiraceae bacterium]
MSVKVILWDIDATLLNFEAAEREGIRMGFDAFGLGPCTDEMIARYSVINRKYWEALERGEMTKPEILVGRFREFFAKEGLPVMVAPAFNDLYQVNLGETICFYDNAYDLVKSLKGRVLQYAASNGTRIAQEKKLDKSGLGALLDGAFISEIIGAEKPTAGFFDAVFAALPEYEKDEFLMVGDSLTSDIRGGIRAGIRTCWYNPQSKPNTTGEQADYEIRNLWEVPELLEQ